ICTLRKFVWLIVGKNGSDFPKVIMTPLGTMGIDSSDRFVELTLNYVKLVRAALPYAPYSLILIVIQ
ncbi:hypothetical protein, partial [Planktothrix mougeotii]|uniref:hypothetical protein n=1 Tax=Planktothrix mougeotii TaxID=54306 RepID=UPI001D135B6B